MQLLRVGFITNTTMNASRCLLLVPLAYMTVTMASAEPGAKASKIRPDRSVSFQSVTCEGTGTPAGSVGESFSFDRKSLTLIFDSFVASDGPSVPETENTKDSAINLQFDVSSGKGVQILDIAPRGFVQLPDLGMATITTRLRRGPGGHVLPGSEDEIVFFGPITQDNLKQRSYKFSTAAAAEGVTFEIMISITVPDGEQGQITVDSLDAKVHK